MVCKEGSIIVVNSQTLSRKTLDLPDKVRLDYSVLSFMTLSFQTQS